MTAMTISAGSFILLICTVFTGLITEAIKKMCKVDRPNLLAAYVSVVVGIAVPIGYLVVSHLKFDMTAVLFIISIVVLSWLSAMLGYDKVIQTLAQLRR